MLAGGWNWETLRSAEEKNTELKSSIKRHNASVITDETTYAASAPSDGL